MTLAALQQRDSGTRPAAKSGCRQRQVTMACCRRSSYHDFRSESWAWSRTHATSSFSGWRLACDHWSSAQELPAGIPVVKSWEELRAALAIDLQGASRFGSGSRRPGSRSGAGCWSTVSRKATCRRPRSKRSRASARSSSISPMKARRPSCLPSSERRRPRSGRRGSACSSGQCREARRGRQAPRERDRSPLQGTRRGRRRRDEGCVPSLDAVAGIRREEIVSGRRSRDPGVSDGQPSGDRRSRQGPHRAIAGVLAGDEGVQVDDPSSTATKSSCSSDQGVHDDASRTSFHRAVVG